MANDLHATAADGTTIAWSRRGQAPGDADRSVVLVHGITESAPVWEPITQRLAGEADVVLLDLRGHGASGRAERYDLEAMAGDVVAVMAAAGVDRPHLVGHSLGGAVVSAVGAAAPVASVVNVDQSLQLGAFKDQLVAVEGMLRDADAFPAVIEGLFEQLRGPALSDDEFARVGSLRRPEQDVVLGVWDLLLTESLAAIDAVVEQALGGYVGSDVPYLSLFGVDPGTDYAPWLARFIARSEVEVWDDTGHYPHLVDPDRFVARLEAFWADGA